MFDSAAPEYDLAKSAGTVLVLGGNGFIGGHLVDCLREDGWRVLRGVRPRPTLSADERACDLSRLLHKEDWLPLLEGVDAVVNAAGILREQGSDRFQTVHHDAPLALADACAAKSIDAFVQISALGNADDGEFVASKHRFDQVLRQHLPGALVLRPGVVFSTRGSYGGTSLLRAMSATPCLVVIPGDGQWQMQPVAAEDLARLVILGLRNRISGVFEVAAAEPISLRDYLASWREWLRIPGACYVNVPLWLVDSAVAIGDRIGRGPIGATTWRMLKRGNVTEPDAHARLQATFGAAPRPITQALQARHSEVQDRWQAQLYPVAPALKLGVILLWLLSALAGWLTPASTIEALAQGSPLANMAPVALARAAAGVDLALALWLLISRRPRAVLVLMAVCVLAYTLGLGLLRPDLWLDPLGGLAKNLVVLPALCALWVLLERR